jgi:hypothetical protein
MIEWGITILIRQINRNGPDRLKIPVLILTKINIYFNNKTLMLY